MTIYFLAREQLEFRDFDGLEVKFSTEHIETKNSPGSELQFDRIYFIGIGCL